jgi:hypothetical protein
MRSLLSKLLILSLFALPLSSFGQCVPNTSYTVPGIYPDSLPVAYVDTPYITVIDFRMPPADTNVGSFPATIDSVELVAYNGLPPGFTYTCDRANCMYYPDENGCVEIAGTAAAGDFGNWPLEGVLKIYFRVVTTPGTITDTNTAIVLQVCTPDSCEGLPNTSILDVDLITGVKTFPNPAMNEVSIEIYAEQSGETTWSLYDLMGREVRRDVIYIHKGRNVFTKSLNDLVPGAYVQRFGANGGAVGSVLLKR